MATNPDWQPDELYREGTKLAQNQQYLEALTIFNRIVELDPKNDMAWVAKGVVHSHLNEYQEAYMAFGEALKVNPNNKRALDNQDVVSKYIDPKIILVKRSTNIDNQLGFFDSKKKSFSIVVPVVACVFLLLIFAGLFLNFVHSNPVVDQGPIVIAPTSMPPTATIQNTPLPPTTKINPPPSTFTRPTRTYPPTQVPTVKPTSYRTLTYRNPTYGYSINYPANWEKKEDYVYRRGYYYAEFYLPPYADTDISFSIYASRGATDLAKEFVNMVADLGTGINEISHTAKEEIAGNLAYRFDYSTDKQYGYRKYTKIVTIIENTKYIITIRGAPNYYDDHSRELEGMIDSFVA